MPRLREFFTSSSGLAPARQGLALGWVISILTGITVLLGAKKAEADSQCPRTWTTCNESTDCAEKGTDEDYRYCTHKRAPDCSYSRIACWCSTTHCP